MFKRIALGLVTTALTLLLVAFGHSRAAPDEVVQAGAETAGPEIAGLYCKSPIPDFPLIRVTACEGDECWHAVRSGRRATYSPCTVIRIP